MGNVRLYGATSGYTELAAPAVASDNTLTLPAGGFGKILQVVSVTQDTELSTTSTSFVTSGLTATITPTSATSKILVTAFVPIEVEVEGRIGYTTLFRGTVAGTNLAGSTGMSQHKGGSTYTRAAVGVSYLDSPATTSAQVYTLGFKVNVSSTIRVFDNNVQGSMTLMEVSA